MPVLKVELVDERSGWVHCALGGWRCGLNWHDSCGLVGRDASYAGALCKRNRFGERRFV